MNGITEIADSLSAELKRRLPNQRKTQRTKLALLVATMLDVRSANLMDLAAGLPREADRTDMRYQWITRLLGNPLVISDAIMEPFSREVLERAAADGQPLVLILDQSKVSDRHQVLMLALRCGERALPLAWRVEETDGAIGFDTQRALLGRGRSLAARAGQGPAAGRPLLRHRRSDRLVPGARLGLSPAAEGQSRRVRRHRQDDDRKVRQGPGLLSWKTSSSPAGGRAPTSASSTIRATPSPGSSPCPKNPATCAPLSILDRWGIEPMFSDFKSRGFGIEDTQLRYADRLDRLILVMALALYVAVSTGQWDAVHHPTPSEKKVPRTNQRKSPEAEPPGSPEGFAASSS